MPAPPARGGGQSTFSPGTHEVSTSPATESDLGRAMPADRDWLRQQRRAIVEALRRGRPTDRRLARFHERLNRSIALAEARRQNVPQIRYDLELPVSAEREKIAAAIREHQVVIVCGETGSGKSTQLPKICLELGRGVERMIGHTQPRRIAARSVAARIAEELHCPLGQAVGYKIRFTDETGPRTYVKLMTDGILLAESQNDPGLDQYDTIILDEAHERSLNIDFLIGYLKRLLPRRRDLKLIITSATIDAARFAQHFASPGGPAPVIEVTGRTFPVEIRWRPLPPGDESAEPDLERAVADAVDELAREDRGDILVFMPTERDIHELAKVLRDRTIPGDAGERKTEILPLYARLSLEEQQRVFHTRGQRRIVIATNVAESSLTVPGIRAVIDPGTARIRALLGADQDPAAADRADFPGVGRPAHGALRTRRTGRLHPPVRRRRLPPPRPLHRPRDSADQPRLGDPPDRRLPAGRARRLSLSRPAPRRRRA